ncbi:MAG: tetratricopeptide repeat protein [Cyanobacteria bacterium REEB67]|nr:tetratricopeptide repeat protein [Cyanobacteria bacterium REEB67]
MQDKFIALTLLVALVGGAAQPVNALAPGVDDLQKGIQLYGANKNAQSLVALNKAVTAMPNEPFTLLARADTLLSMEKPKEAFADLTKALKLSHYKGGSHSRLGLCYLQLHQPALAEKELEESIKLNELDILRWANWLDYLNLAAAKQGLRKYKEANTIRELGNKLRLQQNARDTRETLDMQNSLVVADRAVQVQPENLYSHYMRGVIRLNAGSSLKAVEDFNLIIKRQPKDALSYYFRADAYMDAGKTKEAIDDYSKIIAMAPLVVAVVDIAETGRCKSSGKAYDESAVTLEDIYYLRASAYRRLSKLKEARADLNACLKLEPCDLDIKVMNIDLLTAEGKKAEALKELEALVKANPKDIHCLQMAATAYSNLGLSDKALAIANNMVKSSTGETNALLCRAQIFEKLNRWQEAVADYTKAIDNDDFNDDALAGRARAYARLGDWHNTLKDCNAALKSQDFAKPELLQLKAKASEQLARSGNHR